ncbi:MAG: hypothetical protein ACLR1T_14400 [Evtepia gabavorous]
MTDPHTLPPLSFAPLEGITGWIFRQVHHAMFPGLSRYYTPSSPPPRTVPSLAGGCGTCTPTTTAGSRWCPSFSPTGQRISSPRPGCSRTWATKR